MSKEYIEKEAFVAELKERQEKAKEWLKEASCQEIRVRADAVMRCLAEIKLTLDKLHAVDVKPVVRSRYEKRDKAMSSYLVRVRQCNTQPDTVEPDERRIPDVSRVVQEGMFIRFQRERKNAYGFLDGFEDLVAYNREYVISWELIERS